MCLIRQRRDGPTHYATHGQGFVVDGSSNGGDGWAQGDVSRADEEDEVNGRVQLRKPEVHCWTSWLSRTHRVCHGQLHSHTSHVRNTICLVF